MRRTLSLVAVLALTAGPARADEDKVFSGPQPGEKLPALKAVGVFDYRAGKELDAVKEADGKPLLLVFVHSTTRPSAALTRALAAYAESRSKDGLRAYVVWLAADRTEAEQFLKRARQSLGFKVPVVISLDGAEGPGAYGLNRKVILTVLVAKDGKVTANFALVQPAVTDAPKIAEEIVKQVGGKAPTLKELEALAFPNQQPARPAEGIQDAQLRELLRPVIRPEAKAEDVQKAAAAVEKYVGDDKAKRADLGKAAKLILSLGYGTDEAKKRLKAWAEKYASPDGKDK